MKIVKLVSLGLIVCLIIVIHSVAPSFFPTLWDLLKRGDIVDTARYIDSFGGWAIVFSFLLTLCVNALGFPPAIIFSTANTIVFGIVPGILLSVLAETVGVAISFILLRHFFRDSAKKIIDKYPKLAKIEKYSGEKGFQVMLIARMIPYIPSVLLNALGALSAISFKDYCIASLVGKIPSTGIEAIIGHDTILHQENPTRLIVTVIIAAILIIWAWRSHNH